MASNRKRGTAPNPQFEKMKREMERKARAAGTPDASRPAEGELAAPPAEASENAAPPAEPRKTRGTPTARAAAEAAAPAPKTESRESEAGVSDSVQVSLFEGASGPKSSTADSKPTPQKSRKKAGSKSPAPKQPPKQTPPAESEGANTAVSEPKWKANRKPGPVEPPTPAPLDSEEGETDLPEAGESDAEAALRKRQTVIFRVAEDEYAVDVAHVREIIRLPEIVRVPGAPPHIAGLCAVRGELLPVADARQLFGKVAAERSEGTRAVVLDLGERTIGLIVDKVSEVLSVDESEIRPTPASVRSADGLVTGMLMLEGGRRIVPLLSAPAGLGGGERLSAAPGGPPPETATQPESRGDDAGEEQIIVFSAGGREFAFAVNQVREILRMPRIAKVPGAPDYVAGVFSLRRGLLAVIRLGTLLGIGDAEGEEQSRIVVADTGRFAFGVAVDRVSRVVAVRSGALRSVGAVSGADCIRGVLELDQGRRPVMLLDAARLISEEQAKALTRRDERAEAAADDRSAESGEAVRSVVFRLGENEYAIPIRHVREVHRITNTAGCPGAPAFAEGLVNLRGDAVVLLNLDKLFERERSVRFEKFLVVEHRGKRAGILIDSASEVLSIPAGRLESVSDLLADSGSERYLKAVAKTEDGRHILLLNIASVLNFLR